MSSDLWDLLSVNVRCLSADARVFLHSYGLHVH